MKFKIGDKIRIIKEGNCLNKDFIDYINEHNPIIKDIPDNEFELIEVSFNNWPIPAYVSKDQIELREVYQKYNFRITDVYNELVLIKNNIDQLMKKIKNDCLGGKYDK